MGSPLTMLAAGAKPSASSTAHARLLLPQPGIRLAISPEQMGVRLERHAAFTFASLAAWHLAFVLLPHFGRAPPCSPG